MDFSTNYTTKRELYYVFSLFAVVLLAILHNFTESSNLICYSHRIFQKNVISLRTTITVGAR